MKIFLALVLGLVLTGTQANPLDDPSSSSVRVEINIKGKDYTLFDQRVAVIRALVNRGWKITEQTKLQIKAHYELKGNVAVDLGSDALTVTEIQSNFIFSPSWMRGLKKGIELELLYGRYMKDAMKFK